MPSDAPQRFTSYGASHLWMLGLFALLAVAAIVLGRRIRATRAESFCSRTLGGCILVVQGSWQIFSMLPANWDLDRSLPFELCDLAWIASVAALIRQDRWTTALVYYWGLTLTSQALITPHLELDFPHPQFWMFWTGHILVVVAAIYLTWGLGRRPTWQGWRTACLVTLAWMGLMLAFNWGAGTNYLYVSQKPPTASVLDLLGDWPWYLVVEGILASALWAAMTWPWQRRTEPGN